VKEFVVYTGLRLGLFLAAFFVVTGLWGLFADSVPVVWAVVLAFVVSGIGSYFLLAGPREAFARRVAARAERASERFDEMKAREDRE